MTNKITITKTRTITDHHSIDVPSWLMLLMQGRKHDAMLALREIAGKDASGVYLPLVQAKRIVEHAYATWQTSSHIEENDHD